MVFGLPVPFNHCSNTLSTTVQPLFNHTFNHTFKHPFDHRSTTVQQATVSEVLDRQVDAPRLAQQVAADVQAAVGQLVDTKVRCRPAA